MPLGYCVIGDGLVLERLAPAWSDLLARSAANEPTLGPAWITTWWRVFGPLGRRRLRVLAFFERGRLVGMAPLASRVHWYRPGIPLRRIEMLASGEPEEDEICSDYLGLIAERDREEDVARVFAKALASGALGAWDELVMPAMDGSGPMPRALSAALTRAGFATSIDEGVPSPYVALPRTWEAYLASLPSTHRYVVKRSLRDFEAWTGGSATFEVATTPAELAEGRRTLLALHAERWSARGRAGVFASPRFTAFHDAVMPSLLAAGALELATLRARGEAIASLYNIVWNGKVYFYQGGRRMDVPKGVRPGIVAHAYAIRRAIERGLREYDFLPGSSRYKDQLATASRPIVALRAVRSPIRDRARQLVERGIERVKALRDGRGGSANGVAPKEREASATGSGSAKERSTT